MWTFFNCKLCTFLTSTSTSLPPGGRLGVWSVINSIANKYMYFCNFSSLQFLQYYFSWKFPSYVMRPKHFGTSLNYVIESSPGYHMLMGPVFAKNTCCSFCNQTMKRILTSTELCKTHLKYTALSEYVMWCFSMFGCNLVPTKKGLCFIRYSPCRCVVPHWLNFMAFWKLWGISLIIAL